MRIDPMGPIEKPWPKDWTLHGRFQARYTIGNEVAQQACLQVTKAVGYIEGCDVSSVKVTLTLCKNGSALNELLNISDPYM